LNAIRYRISSARRFQRPSSCVARKLSRDLSIKSLLSMDNDGFNYSQNLPNGNPNILFDRFWEHYNGQLPSSLNEAYPSQSAPFFQFSAYGNEQKPYTTGPSPKALLPASQIHTLQTMHSSYQPDAFDLTQRQRAGPIPSSRTQPSNKRQKIAHPTSSSYGAEILQDTATRGHGGLVGGPESECCSSCSDGIPCASPDCAPCSEPGCNSKTIEVIPCNKKACEQPACTDQCLSIGIQNQQALLNQGLVPGERVMSKSIEPWNAQMPRTSSQRHKSSLGDMLDPALKAFDGPEHASAAASPSPTTPSMGNNIQTPYSPNIGLPTPQLDLFSHQNAYPMQSGDVLSGTGAMFNSLAQPWPEQTFSESNNLNNASPFHCTWDGCSLPFMNYDDWLPHLHKDHVDPQMIFGCPIQAENCPQTIDTNPLDHLKMDHGFNFDMNDNNFSCPAPDCLPTETFCDPAMLHNHFDYAHATPAQGGLRCRLEKTCDFFGDYSQLFSHINEQHQPAPIPKDEDIDLSLPATTVQFDCPAEENNLHAKSSGSPSNGEIVHCCMWKANNQICGLTCQSEVELQTHIKDSHLDCLDRHSGYNCLWEDCKRKEMPLEKQGFSQRGKLERHMQTHTNCK
jgi:hypothetical protein